MSNDDTDREWEQRSIPACPNCAALEAEVTRLRRAVEEMARQQRLELERQIAHERNAKAALLRELAARLPDLLSPHGICQLCGAEGGHQPDCLLRRVDAEAGETR